MSVDVFWYLANGWTWEQITDLFSTKMIFDGANRLDCANPCNTIVTRQNGIRWSRLMYWSVPIWPGKDRRYKFNLN